MRHLMLRVLVLLLMVGFLIFAPLPESKTDSCVSPCYQSCISQFRECSKTEDNITCCILVNQCMEECGSCRLCD
jgi:hypothetical protein